VVIAREDVPGDKRLVAYVVASHEPTPTFSELRSFLKEKLPDYMIPSAFVYLDSLPLTPNGKVDRRALPTPDLERSRLETKFVAPRTPVEKVLAKIWSEVLSLERVGVHDNFFELGGHSLLATQVVSRVCQAFEVELSLRVFFEKPTVAGLTEVLENYETVPGRASAIAQILEKIDAMDAKEIRKMLHDKRKR
jgi:acyl carrier protein